jgi:hypothetical protein
MAIPVSAVADTIGSRANPIDRFDPREDMQPADRMMVTASAGVKLRFLWYFLD